jgi:hypothetical protein
MEVFAGVKITKVEAMRVAATELAILSHDWRGDITVKADAIIEDAKRIFTYLETGI